MSQFLGAERTKLVDNFILQSQIATRLGVSLLDHYSVIDFSKLSLSLMYSELDRLKADCLSFRQREDYLTGF